MVKKSFFNMDTSNNSVFAEAKTNNCENYHTGHIDNRLIRDARNTIINNGVKTKTNNLGFSWAAITTMKYRNDKNVKSLIVIKYKGGYDAEVIMYEKDNSSKYIWTETVRCAAVFAMNGAEKVEEGDFRIPLGDFSIGKTFGLKTNPGTSLEYIDIDENIYICNDETAYNKIINIKDVPHNCTGECLFDSSPEYNYGFEIVFNSENEYGKGSGVFFHCRGPKAYTCGCIAVPEDIMIYILTKIDKNTRVIINYSD